MSTGLQGLAYFPGIDQLISASYTLAHGITPGVIQVEMPPQPNFTAEMGSFFFYYGDLVLEFADCKVDSVSFDASASGFVWRLAILDRRWMWAFGQISGRYNLYHPDGSLQPQTAKTPQELAQLCLDAMGEQGYDLSQMPGAPLPTIHWDYAVPARALAALADELGCRVVLRLDGAVAVLPEGEGEELPSTANLQSDSLSIDPPERPDSLVIVGAPVRYQVDLALMAVGWNTDGTIQPLANLDYAPNPLASDGGFDQVDLNYFNTIVDPQLRGKAIESVFRWYQVDPGRLGQIPGYGPIVDVRQILPLGTRQLDTTLETSLGETSLRGKPAQVFGVWFDVLRSTEDTNTCDDLVPLGDGTSDQDKKMLYYRPFAIDAEAGVVKFDDPVYRKVALSASDGTSGQAYGAAELMLRTSVTVRDSQTWSVGRYQRSRDQNSDVGTQPCYIRREDIQLGRVARYGSDYDGQPTLESNQQACDQQADEYLDAAESEFDTPAPRICSYAGLEPISPDGAIQQVTWNVGLQGATTLASRGTDRAPYTVPYSQRRLMEKIRQAISTLSNERKDP
jgi:hypothetical protein